MRTKPRALPVAVAVILTLVAAVALPQAAATTSKPTLRLSSLCEDYPLVSGIEVRARGFAPYTVITETVQRAYDDGSSDSFSSQTTLGPDGGGYIARYRANEILTYTVSLDWGDSGHLEKTLRPGCAPPKRKADCKHGGWRDFVNKHNEQRFKSQGRCVKFVKRTHRH